LGVIFTQNKRALFIAQLSPHIKEAGGYCIRLVYLILIINTENHDIPTNSLAQGCLAQTSLMINVIKFFEAHCEIALVLIGAIPSASFS